jgi:hypothetical protein
MNHTPEPWRLGKIDGCVVADSSEGLFVGGGTGPDALEYYGGNLICESVIQVNALRIVHCVNACAGLTYEEILEAVTAYKKRRTSSFEGEA